MSTLKGYEHLEARPGGLYRQLFLKGKRIRAEIVYTACTALDEVKTPEDLEPRTPEQVAADFGLPVEMVLEAIEYCRANPQVLAADHAREERMMAACGQLHPEYKYDPKKYYKPLTSEEYARIIADDDLPGR